MADGPDMLLQAAAIASAIAFTPTAIAVCYRITEAAALQMLSSWEARGLVRRLDERGEVWSWADAR